MLLKNTTSVGIELEKLDQMSIEKGKEIIRKKNYKSHK